MSKSRVLSEFWQFLMQEKKYWLVPIAFTIDATHDGPLPALPG